MYLIRKYIGDLFLPLRFYVAGGLAICLFVLAYFSPAMYPIVVVAAFGLLALLVADYFFIFLIGRSPAALRHVRERLSNGDSNDVMLTVMNRMRFPVKITIIDELPRQFEARDFSIRKDFDAGQKASVSYIVRPFERGLYEFGDIILYVESLLGLVQRRFVISSAQAVSVYPSFFHLKEYQALARQNYLQEQGGRQIRKIGQSMEFEQIKDYVTGDDLRNVNWKATARKGSLMINNYTDEKSQQVYCIIDKGRLMKMPFNGLTLLDHAINSSLILSSICLQKQDKVGLIAFAEKMDVIIPADKRPVQRENIMEALYKQQTGFLESDFEMLYLQIRHKIRQRSLLILYTNFETLNGLKRQIGYLRSIARHHLLLLVFFENTELTNLAQKDSANLEDVYVRTIAEKMSFEKRLIVKDLMKHGILSILTPPEGLTLKTVNKYLELKSKQAI